MALTISVQNRSVFGTKRIVVADVDFDSSYPTGGESLTAADLGLKKIDLLLASPEEGISFEYDYTNSKLLAYVPGAAISSTAGSNTIDDFVMDGVAATATVSLGLGDASGLTSISFGAQLEVGNTKDLSTITDVRIFVVGF